MPRQQRRAQAWGAHMQLFCVDGTCKNQLSDDELFLYACCDSIESIPESDPATVSDLYLDGGLVSRLASPFFVLMLTSPHLALSLLLADYFQR